MNRFLAMALLVIVLVVVVTLPFIIWGEARFASFSHQETGITSFLLTSLELIGLVISIAIVFFILYQYIHYRRPYRLIFDAFSNESVLDKDENKPLNLSILAKEELIRQFKVIFNELKVYNEEEDQVVEPQFADVLYHEEDLARPSIEIYVSVDQIIRSGMIEGLKEVIRTLTDREDINLMNLVGEIAPKEVTPVMKFIETIFPPHIIRATGHLQYKNDLAAIVGITFEFVDLGNQRNLMVRTLWQPSNAIKDAAETQTPATPNTPIETATNGVADRYIELLRPAVHWLALMFLEQKLISHTPFINRFLKVRENWRQARILYLLGALYYARSYQFKTYKLFFRQLAVEHLCQAVKVDSNWCLPYLYLANLYTFKMIETAEVTKREIREKLLNEALLLYEEALKHAKALKHPDVKICYEQRITVGKALAELSADNKQKQLEEKAKQDIQDAIARQDPALYDPCRADCAAYLYNLAIWYEKASERYIAVPNPTKEARRYLAYSLARSQSLWDSNMLKNHFPHLASDGDLEKLKEELDKKLSEKPELAKLRGEDFKTEIDMILEKVEQRLGR